ncbi:sigma-70 family RNA polymerase sigma factor [Gloeobacter morelensis]|uniref:sigma-70 family RNA polymerase sigma factor n=1 Tax=Gloeobacter morelensis TaxID=2907343 RepID=UPI001E51C8B3|nr:sigma-70 family RNA polymerase sigma factor [Gloeobacter morelensis]
MKPSDSDVTQLLQQWSSGDRQALDKLYPLIYKELHLLAERCTRYERAHLTLQATALLNEAYLRLVDQRRVPAWQDRIHFYAVAAKAMRHALVDYARNRQAEKRGGGFVHIPLDKAGEIAANGHEEGFMALENDEELLALHAALQRLTKFDEQMGRIVELRYFGGLGNEMVAQELGISVATVKRRWSLAKAWLARELQG